MNKLLKKSQNIIEVAGAAIISANIYLLYKNIEFFNLACTKILEFRTSLVNFDLAFKELQKWYASVEKNDTHHNHYREQLMKKLYQLNEMEYKLIALKKENHETGKMSIGVGIFSLIASAFTPFAKITQLCMGVVSGLNVCSSYLNFKTAKDIEKILENLRHLKSQFENALNQSQNGLPMF